MMHQLHTISEKPEWLKICPPKGDGFPRIKGILKHHSLHTVCEEAHCPNISECWSGGTATFMIMGDTCTRACKFCAIKTAFPAKPLDMREPDALSEAISKMNLDYVVITSVDRDDLKDQGASHFAECIKKIKEKKEIKDVLVEVLIPDFRGREDLISLIIDAKPDVIAHNIETVKRLQHPTRDPRANYDQSLKVLRLVKEKNPEIHTKSSIMVGIGETEDEVVQAMKDLRDKNVDIVTFGQYLQPSRWHLEVKEYVSPERFNYYKEKGLELGFIYVASGPFVRSSYRAGEFFIKGLKDKKIKQEKTKN